MSNLIYDSSEVRVTFGVPVTVPGILEASFTLEDFNQIQIVHSAPKFDVEKGVFREAAVVYDPGQIVGVNISLHYGSIDNENFDKLYKAQEFGLIGVPMTIRILNLSNDGKKRKSYAAPVAVLTTNPDEAFSVQASENVYIIKTPYFQRFYS